MQKKTDSILILILTSVSLGIICTAMTLVTIRMYTDRLRIQLDPLSTWLDSNADERKLHERILVIGDSRVTHWGRYPIQYSSDYLGFDGFTSEQVKLSLANGDLSFDHAKLVILQLGVNDLKSLGLVSDYERIVERSFTNTTKIAKTFANAGKKVLILTVFPTGDISIPRMLVWSDKIEQGINKHNLNLATINEPNVLVVNVDHLFDKSLSLHKDALHLNGLGYERLNTHIAPIIAKLLELE